MTEMEWALSGLRYLAEGRAAIHEEFNQLMGELPEYAMARTESWYPVCKNIIPALYHFSMEFTADRAIPGAYFSSPSMFAENLVGYKSFVEKMDFDLREQVALYANSNDIPGEPSLVFSALKMVNYILDSINHVLAQKPASNVGDGTKDDIEFVAQLSRRFHEAVLSLKKHPHGGIPWKIADEWDCQYLFRSILAAYFPDVRNEEWSPSVAGSSARCEFLIKPLRLMIELKYARKSSDQKKFKQELATDLLDYGGHGDCDYVVVLIYDPSNHLTDPIALQNDLSGPTKGIKDVRIVISPPRD